MHKVLSSQDKLCNYLQLKKDNFISSYNIKSKEHYQTIFDNNIESAINEANGIINETFCLTFLFDYFYANDMDLNAGIILLTTYLNEQQHNNQLSPVINSIITFNIEFNREYAAVRKNIEQVFSNNENTNIEELVSKLKDKKNSIYYEYILKICIARVCPGKYNLLANQLSLSVTPPISIDD